LKILENKKILLAPYNDLTQNLYKKYKNIGLDVIGYFDSKKNGKKILSKLEDVNYDYVIVNSPKYWKDLLQYFDITKVLLAHNEEYALISYLDYTHQFVNDNYERRKYDVLFLAYNKSNVIDCSLVIRKLSNMGLKSAIIDISNDYYKNVKEGFLENTDIEKIKYEILEFVDFSALVTSIDWEDKLGGTLIKRCQEKGIPTIGLVDGIEDFEDADYDYERNAYQTVEYVLVTGENDLKFLQNKIDKCFIVGLPKMYHLYKEDLHVPKKDLVVINVNFTYGTFVEVRDMWLGEVIEACKLLNLDYIITQHHADHGDLRKYNVSMENVYDTIRKSSIVVSRFSTVISEALALGKKVIYHNPHNEKVQLYKNPLGAYSISCNKEELIEKIQFELEYNTNQRERVNKFLDKQFNINSEVEPAILAAQKIKEIKNIVF